jgi:hypothetical protein
MGNLPPLIKMPELGDKSDHYLKKKARKPIVYGDEKVQK